MDDELTGSYVFTFSGGLRRRCPEVGFEEISIDFLQARFWIVSGLPTIRELSRCRSHLRSKSPRI
jgi:hypothetical protein